MSAVDKFRRSRSLDPRPPKYDWISERTRTTDLAREEEEEMCGSAT